MMMMISRRAILWGGAAVAAIGAAAVADSYIPNVAPYGFRPMLKGYSAPIDFSALDQVTLTTATIYSGVEATSQFNLHNYLVYFDDKFWCMWTTSPLDEVNDEPQQVMYSTSADGMTGWTSPQPLSGLPPDDFRFMARGFWVRDGALLALYSYDEVYTGFFGASLELRAKSWNGSAWSDETVIADDTINNFAPKLLPNGDWLTSRRDHDAAVYMMRGDIGSWQSTAIANPAEVSLSEPTWELLPDKSIRVLFRDGDLGGWIYESFSYDFGATWSAAKRTNYPDASSKIFSLRLSDGRYIFISNPRQPTDGNRDRTPLTISISDDGDVYDRMVIIRDEATSPTWDTDAKVPGYMYPHAIEHGDYLYVAYSRNKEDIQISRIALSDLPAA